MSGSVRRSRIISLAVALLWAIAGMSEPKRVVSINLCTDQLALELAAPGQLVSVTHMTKDPENSSLHEIAAGLHSNGSGAEEVYLLEPDLVLAGTFTSPDTVAMLRGLGIEVAVFAPANSIDEIPLRLLKMGVALGREDIAEALVAKFREDFANLQEDVDHRPRVALTYVNSYSVGPKTLAGDILDAAGFANVAAEIGLDGYGKIGLEELVLLAPDVIVQGRDYPGAARAEDNLNHPALKALGPTQVYGELVARDWSCGTPRVLDAIRDMRDLRQSVMVRQ